VIVLKKGRGTVDRASVGPKVACCDVNGLTSRDGKVLHGTCFPRRTAQIAPAECRTFEVATDKAGLPEINVLERCGMEPATDELRPSQTDI